MSRMKALVATLVVAGASAMAAPVAAQDGPSVTVDPATVDAAGDATITVSGSGYTVTDVFVVPCEGATTTEELENAGDGACDLASLTPATVEDGSFEIEISYTVPEGGMCFAAGDIAQTEVSGACIAVGGDDMAAEDDAAEEDDAAADEDDAADDEAADDDGATEEMASTGADTLGQVTIMGGLLAVAGAALLARRRLAHD